MGSITNQKFIYDAAVPILHRNTTDFSPEMTMTTATITLAHAFGKIRAFAIELYTAHGGWFAHDAAQPASGALARNRTLADRVILGPFCASALTADMARKSSTH
jgi:hypothetical protein